jgi:hypothetical protein
VWATASGGPHRVAPRKLHRPSNHPKPEGSAVHGITRGVEQVP